MYVDVHSCAVVFSKLFSANCTSVVSNRVNHANLLWTGHDRMDSLCSLNTIFCDMPTTLHNISFRDKHVVYSNIALHCEGVFRVVCPFHDQYRTSSVPFCYS